MSWPRRPEISVVVPCRRHTRELRLCLAALAQQQIDVPYEVVVVDSAADPEVVAAAAGYDWVKVVSSPTPLYAEEARNLGFERARAGFLATVDADCVPAPTWLAAAYRALQDGAIMAGGPVGDAQPWHPIAVSDNVLQFAELSPFRSDLAAAYLPGCNYAIRRDAYETNDPIPTVGDIAGADVLFSQAAVARWPGRVRFVQAMRVNHQGRTTLRGLWRHMYSLGHGRAALNISLKPTYRRLGRHTLMVAPVAAWRWFYIAGRFRRWHLIGLLRYLLLTPIVAIGLLAWAIGFRDGCRQPVHEVGLGH